MSKCDKPDLSKYKLWVMCGDRAGFYNREIGYCDTKQDYVISTDHPDQRNPIVVDDGGMFSGIYSKPSDTIHEYMVEVGHDKFYPLVRLVCNAEKHMEIRQRAKPNSYPIDFIPDTIRKKPQSKLSWREITPQFCYKMFSDSCWNETGYHWQNDYRLVQFKLEHEGKFPRICNGKVQTDTTTDMQSYKLNSLYLTLECSNNWSAPVVVPIDFYKKLDTYVAEFNQKLNCREV